MIGSESMAEGMAGKAVFPAKMLFMGQDKVRDTLMVDGLGRVSFLREKPVTGALISRKRIPVLQDQPPCLFRELRVARGTVFGGTDQDPVSGVFDIGTF